MSRSFINDFPPSWWHLHGSKLQPTLITDGQVHFEGSAASIRITKNNADSCFVEYRIVWSANTGVTGKVYIPFNMLASAFGLTDQVGKFGKGFVEEYEATAAEQGEFIRKNQFLNIPGPGTGHDGDPNISIQITKQVIDAIKSFIPESYHHCTAQ